MNGAGREPAWIRGIFAAIFAIAALVIYLPIAVMFVFSFNSGRYQVMPFRDFTLQWYERLLADPQYTAGLANSVLIAGAVSVTATAIAFACAYSLVNALSRKDRGDFVRSGATCGAAGSDRHQSAAVLRVAGTGALAVARLRRPDALRSPARDSQSAQPDRTSPRSHEEAAWALGASRLRAIVEIVLPSCRFALVATLIITFTFAFDEFVIAYFLTNFEITLPIRSGRHWSPGSTRPSTPRACACSCSRWEWGIAAQILFTRREA